MPKFKQPPPLEDLALTASVVWLENVERSFIKKIGDLCLKNVKILEEYHKIAHEIFSSNVPYYLFDRICQEIFNTTPTQNSLSTTSINEYFNEESVALGLSYIIISPYLRHLDFFHVPERMWFHCYSNLSSMTGIEYLNLAFASDTKSWARTQFSYLYDYNAIFMGLASMKNLKTLVFNCECTDEILALLGTACPHLHQLDARNSKSITNNSVKYLSNLSSLRLLYLKGTLVNEEGYKQLIIDMPFLEDIETSVDIGKCLEYVKMSYQSYKAVERPKLQLKIFSSEFVTTKNLQILAEIFPEITTVVIYHISDVNDLMALIAINKLSVLKVNFNSFSDGDFVNDRLVDVLRVKGCNLTQLHLKNVSQLDINVLTYIGQYCPELKILTFSNCFFIESTSFYTEKLKMPPLMNLEKLTIESHCFEQHVEFLLSSCFKIKTVYIRNIANVDLIDRILLNNPMKFLESLYIASYAPLSLACVYNLIEVFPNLKMLGTPDGLSMTDKEELACYISTKNFDLDIQDTSFWEWRHRFERDHFSM